jgi:hypothetical protein
VQPGDLPGGEGESDASTDTRRLTQPEPPQKQSHKDACQRQMQPRIPARRSLRRQEEIEKIRRIEDRTLTVGDEGGSAEFVGVPQRQRSLPQGACRELPPDEELSDRVVPERIPGGEAVRRGVCRPGSEIAELPGGNENLPTEQTASQKKEGKKRDDEQRAAKNTRRKRFRSGNRRSPCASGGKSAPETGACRGEQTG